MAGWLALRETENDRGLTGNLDTVLVSPGLGEAARLRLGGYDLINHCFAVRHSPELFFLQGASDQKAHKDKRIVAVEPPDDNGNPRIRRLFPLEWDTARNGHLFGGPAVHLSSGREAALVHAGAVHDGRGLLPGNAFVARRRLPDGAAQWVFTADWPATALDTDGETIFAAFNSGEIVALSAVDGSVRWRQRLCVDGIADGRILDCGIAPTAPR